LKVEGASLLARATLGLVLVAGIVACGGEVASNEFVGTWIEAGTGRTVTFADEGAFSMVTRRRLPVTAPADRTGPTPID